MKTYTESQLQAALVRALPEKLTHDADFNRFHWLEGDGKVVWPVVTPHEWPAIVGMVEDGLTEFQCGKYGDALQEAVNYHCVGVVSGYDHQLKSLAKITCAKWQHRAAALADIGAITVEDRE